jgi:hypothetical protein
VAVVACAGAPTDKESFVRGNDKVQGHYNREDGKLDVIAYDASGKGRPDTWAYMAGARVVRIEIDRDGDGKIDRWEYYAAGGALEKVGYSRAGNGHADAWAFQGSDGSIARIEMAGACGAEPPAAPRNAGAAAQAATSASGAAPPGQTAAVPRITRTEFYERGALARAEEDTDCDGRPDKWETFAGGTLASVALDTTRRGTPDRRLIYGPGSAVRVEVDPNGTGQFHPVR